MTIAQEEFLMRKGVFQSFYLDLSPAPLGVDIAVRDASEYLRKAVEQLQLIPTGEYHRSSIESGPVGTRAGLRLRIRNQVQLDPNQMLVLKKYAVELPFNPEDLRGIAATLSRKGIKKNKEEITVQEAVELSSADMSQTHQVGKGVIKHINEVLKPFGLALDMEFYR